MDEGMLEKARALIREAHTCVLATSSANHPHCSLMAYATNASCDEIYMITTKNSRKYQNMRENPVVSLLIDTRERGSKSGHAETMALTVSGKFQAVETDSERQRVREALSRKHPDMKGFFENSQGEPVRIAIESLLLLEGPTKMHYEPNASSPKFGGRGGR